MAETREQMKARHAREREALAAQHLRERQELAIREGTNLPPFLADTRWEQVHAMRPHRSRRGW